MTVAVFVEHDVPHVPGNDLHSSLPSDYPEGGLRAWLVVFGAWCAMIPSMGLLNTLAVLQAWTSQHQLSHLPESTVGWIFSFYGFFLYVLSAQIGECTRRTPADAPRAHL